MNKGIKLLLQMIDTNIIRKFMRKWQIMESGCIKWLGYVSHLFNEAEIYKMRTNQKAVERLFTLTLKSSCGISFVLLYLIL